MGVNKDHYYRLASNLPKERIQAASALIEELSEENSEKEFKYALQRLISGLASGHDSARIGFSMCLTELISLLKSNDVLEYGAEKFLADVEEHLNKQVKAKHKGKNLRAYLFGKIFAIQSLINSTLIVGVDDKLVLQIIDELFTVALTKSWIREISIVTVIKLMNKLDLVEDEKIVPYILSKFSEHNLLLSMDGLLVYLTIPVAKRKHLSDLANIATNQHWKNDDPLTKGNMPLLKDAFQDRIATSDDDSSEFDGHGSTESSGEVKNNNKKIKGQNKKDINGASIQKGSWNPQLHYVWVLLLSELFQNQLEDDDEIAQQPAQKRQKSNKKSSNKSVTVKLTLSKFWPTFDCTYFSATASSERKHTGLQILDLCFKLPNFNSEFFFTLFDENLTRCLINHVSKKDRVLHNLSLKVLHNALAYAKNNVSAKLDLIRALERQCILFDRVSKTKTIKDCISDILVDEESLEQSVDVWNEICNWVVFDCETELTKQHLTSKKEDSATVRHDIHTFILDSLLALVRNNKKLIRLITNKVAVKTSKMLTLEFVSNAKNILEYLAKKIYLSETESDERIIKTSKERLNSILADLLESSKGKVDWSGLIVQMLFDSEKENKLRSVIENEGETNDELHNVKTEAFEIWFSLGKSIKGGDLDEEILRMNKCLVMLFSTALLELYGGDAESFGILSDLVSIYSDFNEGSESSNSNILNTLVDLMLSYLTQKSGLKKRVGISIWESVAFDSGEEQLERLFDVLLTRENKLGMEQLFNQVVDGYEEDDEEEEDIEEENDDDDADDDDDDEDDDDDNDDDNGKEQIEEIEKTTTSALAEALNVSENTSGKGPEDKANNNETLASDDGDDDDGDDDDYESDESMSDEQMLALDSQLSAIFQQRQNSIDTIKSSSKNGNERKLEAKEARELMALCKLRVLDLLDFYVTIHQKKSECVSIAITALDVMSLTVDITVGEKAHKLIKKICKNTFEIADEEELEKSYELIKQILTRASKAKFNALSQACSQVSIYVVRSIVAFDDTKYEQVIADILSIYQGRLIEWSLDSNDKSNASLFTDLINWLSSKRSNS